MDVSNKMPLIILAAVVIIYGALGWLDVKNYAQGGWATAPDNTVTQVLNGSPAEAGGLRVGDKIVSLDGIAVSDAEANSKRNRPTIGETWEFVVERDGATETLDVTFGEPVAERKFLAHAGFIVGFCMIIFTMRAYLQSQTQSTHALAIAGVLFSLLFLAGPYWGSHTLRSIDAAVVVFLSFIGVASILNFLLIHLRGGGNKLIYLPAVAAGLFIGWRILATPEATDGLNRFGNIFIGLIAGFYLIACLATVYKAFGGASADERESQGLKLMMIGALIGLVPPVIGIATSIVAPQVVLPGQNFYFLSFVAIPVTWSMAALKGVSSNA